MVRFLSKMFHPNIFKEDGQVGIELHWSPAYDVSAILVSIQSLLGNPEVEKPCHSRNLIYPANQLASQLFKENKQEYLKRVMVCVEQSWSDN